MSRLPTIPGTDVIDFERMMNAGREDLFQSALNSAKSAHELSAEQIKEIEQAGKSKNITPVFPVSITLTSGEELKTLYGSPFPLHLLHLKTVYTCDYCMEFFQGKDTLKLHYDRRCPRKPRGLLVYQLGNVSVYEVNGNTQKAYCRNICLLSRLFLESKTVFYDTEHFMFYVLTLSTANGEKFIGYFSREMYHPPSFSMMCLMVLPIHQGNGYGRLLIELSYEMAKKQNLTLSPETPLSEEGKHAHEQFWIWTLCDFFNKNNNTAESPIKEISEKSGIRSDDLLETLKQLKWIQLPIPKNLKNLKYNVDKKFIAKTLKAEEQRVRQGRVHFDADCFTWVPKRITPQMNGFDVGLERDSEVSDDEEPEQPPVPSKKVRKTAKPVPTASEREQRSRKCKKPRNEKY